MKRVCGIVSIILVLTLLSACGSKEASTDASKKPIPTATPKPSLEPTPKPTTTPAPTPKSTPNPVEQAKREIESKTREFIKKYEETSIKEISVNEHMGTEKPDDYIVLAHLSFDRMNTAGTAKGMLDMYGSDLAANLAKAENVTEVTVFWEVPYLKKGSNIAKANYQRKGDKMYLEDSWYDPGVFN